MFALNLLLFLMALSILIFVHEMGHYLFAKLFGVYCHEFSLGMGPAIVKKKFKKDKETTYSLRWFPIGGYVAMAGETFDSDKDITIPYERTINGIKAWKRAIVVVAGATINFLFGLFLIFILAFSGGFSRYIEESIINVEENSVAYQSGLRQDDIITSIEILGDPQNACYESCNIESSIDLFNYLSTITPNQDNPNQSIKFNYLRDNQEGFSIVERTYDTENSTYSAIGISIQTETIRPGFIEGIKLSFERFNLVIEAMFSSLASLFTSEGFSQVGGPIQIYQVSANQAQQGFLPYVWFLALLSINLGFFNLLPFPGLDGSRFLVSIYETIVRKKVNPKVESYINAIGIILLLVLMLVVTVKDIVGLF